MCTLNIVRKAEIIGVSHSDPDDRNTYMKIMFQGLQGDAMTSKDA